MNSIKALVDELRQTRDSKAKKSNHTLYLDDLRWRAFAAWCQSVNRTPSEVVDRLIALTVDEVSR